MKINLLIIILASAQILFANGPKAQQAYIEKYKDVAIREMKAHGIPASITLAQGLLESASGSSYLATEANNHFGIKCHLDWEGDRVFKDDDRKDECFRSYKDPDESFRDHSLFLRNRARYAFLFEEDPTDYKAWAKGLKKAGYATNRKYDDMLIDLVERFELDQYDLEDYEPEQRKKKENALDPFDINESKNRVDYVITRQGDTFEIIAQAAQKRVSDILKHNELSFDTECKPGMIIYLQPKRKRAARDQEIHIVKEGEDMHGISQNYAIKLKYLYRINGMRAGQQPLPGQTLKLR